MKPKLEQPPQGPTGPVGAQEAPPGRGAAASPPSRTHAPDARPQWPADAVERWPLAKLIPYARNARTHSDAQVAQIAGSIREWGWTVPVLVDEDGTLIAGHGRVLAAHRLGLREAPTMVARGWSEAKKRAYRLADNQLALNAGWDVEMLGVELADLRDMAVDLSSMGFSEGELAGIFGRKAGLTDPDEAPEPPARPRSRLGDVWLLGQHRLACGDCTAPAVVAGLLAGASPALMVTDPPYGVEYDPDWRNRADRANGKPYGARAIGRVTNDDRVDWRDAYALFPGDVIYLWHAGLHAREVLEGLVAIGFEPRAQIIWAKSHFPIGRGHYHVQHEPCWYAVRRGKSGQWSGDRTQTTLWQIAKPAKSETGHSTQKPVECMLRPIENHTVRAERLYDPFVGSGTTIIAAEMTERICYAVEIDPSYCDVTILRWQAFTGWHAVRERDGCAFDEIAEDKKPATPKGRRPKVVENAVA